MPEDFNDLDKYAKTRSNPYDISYEVICREVMGQDNVRNCENLSASVSPDTRNITYSKSICAP